MAFESWMSNVNALLFADTGFVIPDLPDEPFRDYYDDGLFPKDVVEIMITRNLELGLAFAD